MYIIVHTRKGYVKVPDGIRSSFTQNIADAHKFTKFEDAKPHADELMASVWQGDTSWNPYYTPENKPNYGVIDQLRSAHGRL